MGLKRKLITTMLFLVGTMVFGNGSAADSSERGGYLAARGIIIPPSEIRPESYIASIDYGYPDPDPDSLGLTVRTGNRQIGSESDRELVHIGLKGRKVPFEELPPLNLVFVIDTSGSMYDSDKIGWVKNGLEIFLGKVREGDFVSIITFGEDAEVIFQSSQMNRESRKTACLEAIQGITPGGGTDLLAGMRTGYAQAMANYRRDYTNRVLFLSDGLSESTGAMELAGEYAASGITCSTIGVGVAFNADLMIDLAIAGGGSSRFISDREEMQSIFNTELDRMVVAAGRNLTIELKLLNGVSFRETWGYRYEQAGDIVRYTLPTLHNGDYETILTEVELPAGKEIGDFEIAEVTVNYETVDGRKRSTGTAGLSARVVETSTPVYGVSDPLVLRSSTMLDTAQALIRIGSLYYAVDPEYFDTPGSGTTAPELLEALDIAVDIRKQVKNTRRILDESGFEDEIEILERYIEILGEAAGLDHIRMAALKNDREIKPPVTGLSLNEQLDYLFDEVVLSLPREENRTIAVTGFSYPDDRQAPILPVLNEYALNSISRIDSFTLVERSRLNAILAEQGLQLSGLMDTTNTLELGRLTAAEWIMTGTVIEMAESLVVFVRVVDTQSGEIICVSEILLDRNTEVKALL